jgi:hypothetical protein
MKRQSFCDFSRRYLPLGSGLLLGAVLCLAPLGATAQEKHAAARSSSDGHPDLSGIWIGRAGANFVNSEDPLAANLASRDGTLLNFERDNALIRRSDPNKPLYKPEFWEKVQKLDQDGNNADPSFGCMPAGVPRMGPPAKIVQTPTEMVFLYISGGAQGQGDTYRVIPTDGRAHTPLDDLDGTWKGESIGHWEGDTLVVDSIGFNDTSWLDITGYFHSENMHVVERMHRDGDTLTWQATVDDPDVLIRPWVMSTRTLKLNPDPKATLAETLPCVERDLSHLVTKEHH